MFINFWDILYIKIYLPPTNGQYNDLSFQIVLWRLFNSCFCIVNRLRLTMAQMDKLIARFKTHPKDFTWAELTRILKGLSFQELQGSGSRVKFFNQKKIV